ncbi:hypothetical protein [Helicobacter pullorum]|nr:hypothetical protein [Helicobacter pullorum]
MRNSTPYLAPDKLMVRSNDNRRIVIPFMLGLGQPNPTKEVSHHGGIG